MLIWSVIIYGALHSRPVMKEHNILKKMMPLLAHMLSNLQYHELCFQETKPVVNEAHEPRLCGHVV